MGSGFTGPSVNGGKGSVKFGKTDDQPLSSAGAYFAGRMETPA